MYLVKANLLEIIRSTHRLDTVDFQISRGAHLTSHLHYIYFPTFISWSPAKIIVTDMEFATQRLPKYTLHHKDVTDMVFATQRLGIPRRPNC
jgi:hypothetical protein